MAMVFLGDFAENKEIKSMAVVRIVHILRGSGRK
jgi:hypothetical protein